MKTAVKSQTKILSLQEIHEQYPDQWVLVQVTKVRQGAVVAGRVIAHSRSERAIERAERLFLERNPRAEVLVENTRKFPEDWEIVVCCVED